MFLKRLTTVIVVLILVMQLAACRSNSPSDNISRIDTSSEEIRTDNITESEKQDEDDLPPNSSEVKVYVDDTSSNDNLDNIDAHQDNSNSNAENPTVNTTTSENQDVNTSQQDNSNNSNNNNKTPDNDTSIRCNHGTEDPYQNMSKAEFYANYTPACCNQDATYRSKHYLLSGSLDVSGQYAVEAANRPKTDEKFVRNTATVYLDNGNTYVLMDDTGDEVMRIHKAGGYITLEEVAAYMYAFGGDGTIPSNYTSKKSTKPSSSPWGEYLRVNHSYFKGDTERYPYEPELPDISGCGGSLSYYEMDIGTTGTTTPGYAPKPYIQGNKINRGAARLVYARQDLNGNGIYEQNEVYVFYTHNHYNDFREYLNYYGGWGEMFGNVTGGGEYSSETGAKPTPYVQTAYADFSKQ